MPVDPKTYFSKSAEPEQEGTEFHTSCRPQSRKRPLLPMLIAGGILVLILILVDGKDSARSPLTAIPVANVNNIGGPTTVEQQNLVFMREEEKLAWDLYREMHQIWGLSVFKSVSGEEKEHMKKMLGLLQMYNIPDPVQGDVPGRYVNVYISDIYQSLSQQGRRSVQDALKVCALQEEINILDLIRVSQSATQPKVLEVYAELQRNSISHLRSFAHSLEILGIRYQGVKIPQNTIDSIVQGPMDPNFMLRK